MQLDLPSILPRVAPTLRGGALFIDNSSYSYLNRCDRAGLYHILYHRQLNSNVDALNFGGAVHEGLRVRYESGGLGYETLGAQVTAATAHLKKNPISVGDWRTPEYLVEVLQDYNRKYIVEDFQLLTLGDKPLVELSFAIPLGEIELPCDLQLMSREVDTSLPYNEWFPNQPTPITLRTVRRIPIIWCGRIDLVIQRSGVWISDHKTTSVFGPTYYRQFSLSPQFAGYSFAVQQALDVIVQGYMINVLAIRKPTKTGKGIEFDRRYLPITQQRVAEWRHNTLQKLGHFFNMLATGEMPPMRDYACGRNEWQRPCQYLGICDLEDNQKDMYMFTGDFKDITWSPLLGDEQEGEV